MTKDTKRRIEVAGRLISLIGLGVSLGALAGADSGWIGLGAILVGQGLVAFVRLTRKNGF